MHIKTDCLVTPSLAPFRQVCGTGDSNEHWGSWGRKHHLYSETSPWQEFPSIKEHFSKAIEFYDLLEC